MESTIIDLFCGIGGLGLGAARAGFKLALSVDIDTVLLDLHKTNFPGCAHFQTDVAEISGAALLAAAGVPAGGLTALVGGSPCQGFSRIGKRNSADPRNLLFIRFFELVADTNPAFFLAENVMGILDHPNRDMVDEALALAGAKYTVLDPLVINASDYGAPTIRQRAFFIGYAPDRVHDISSAAFRKAKWRIKTDVGTALSGLPRKLRSTWISDDLGWRSLRSKRSGKFWQRVCGRRPHGIGDDLTFRKLATERLVSGCIATLHNQKVGRRFAQTAQGSTEPVSRMPRLEENGFCPTLRAGTGPDKGSFQALRPIHYSEPRVITPREAARLQGFPDWFRFGPTKWHAFRGIGNSVSPLVSEALFGVLAQHLKV